MCTLMKTADMPTATTRGKAENDHSFIAWYPKPNKEGENMRVRLLYFTSPSKNNRKDPYFYQIVHDHWGKNANNKPIVDHTIVCPMTKYSSYDEDKWVLNEKTGKEQVNCPICDKEREAISIWKNSGWKDKAAMKRHFALQAKFRGIVPVYVINDPNNPKNNGRMKVMILTNKEDYELLDQVVKTEKAKSYVSGQNGQPYEIFNGKDGVDLYLHCETVEETKKNGFVQRVRKMTGIAFDDPSSKYDIPDICEEKLDMFDMDEQFYVSSTKAELHDFYHTYYGRDEVVIPKENVDIFKKKPQNAEPQKKIEVANENVAPKEETVIEDDFPEEAFNTDAEPKKDDSTEEVSEVDDITNFLDDIDKM